MFIPCFNSERFVHLSYRIVVQKVENTKVQLPGQNLYCQCVCSLSFASTLILLQKCIGCTDTEIRNEVFGRNTVRKRIFAYFRAWYPLPW